MLHISTLLKHYKRPEIQEAMIKAAEDREVAIRYGELFGKRPDTLTYPNDILEAVKQGATSFHISEERWHNVMQLNTGMRRQELDALRKGWDLVFDIDCPLWHYSRYIAHLVVQELQRHGIQSVTVKFSGNKGFHIAVPFEAFPEEIHGKNIAQLFPEAARRIALYIIHKITPLLLAHVKEHEGLAAVAQQLGISLDALYKAVCSTCKKFVSLIPGKIEFFCRFCEINGDGTTQEKYRLCEKCQRIMERVEIPALYRCSLCKKGDIEELLDVTPLLQMDTVLISSRHLYRMPYSLHEKSGLCSVPVAPQKILSFEREHARPELVQVTMPFLDVPLLVPNQATQLFLEAFDYLPVVSEEQNSSLKQSFTESEEETLQHAIPADFFPPCMKLGLGGMQDGKKRFLFMVINFLLSCGYEYAAIEVLLDEWNKKNPEPLREVVLKGQLRYVQQTKKKVLPPNCDNQGYYKDMGICKPDGVCAKIKNPVQYAKRKAFLANLEQQKKAEEEKKGTREKLSAEQKEMRRQFREKMKEEENKK